MTIVPRPLCFLMLDFDGVVHPAFPRADFSDAENQYFSFLPQLEAVLRAHPRVAVVVTSSWRHSRPLEVLRAFFSEDLRERVVGSTPDVPQAPGRDDTGTRLNEVRAWLAAQGMTDVPWVALDDVLRLYAPDAPVVLTDDRFGPHEAGVLCAALADPMGFAARCRAQPRSTIPTGPKRAVRPAAR